MLKKEKEYISKDKILRVKIIQFYYDILLAKYRERWKMIELVTNNYQWLGVIKDIRRYVNGYVLYQRTRNYMKALIVNIIANKMLEKLWIYLIVTKLPLVAKKNEILVVYNRLSEMVYFIVMIKRILVEGLVRLFRDNIWKLYRLPESVILD